MPPNVIFTFHPLTRGACYPNENILSFPLLWTRNFFRVPEFSALPRIHVMQSILVVCVSIISQASLSKYTCEHSTEILFPRQTNSFGTKHEIPPTCNLLSCMCYQFIPFACFYLLSPSRYNSFRAFAQLG